MRSYFFQDADDTLTQKPDVTDEKISRRLTETLPCQELKRRFKSKDRPSLPTDMKITSETDKIELSSQSRRQFIIYPSRCTTAENRDETYFTWAAANADNKLILIHEEGRLSSCYSSLSN